jgi:hypothetical protein
MNTFPGAFRQLLSQKWSYTYSHTHTTAGGFGDRRGGDPCIAIIQCVVLVVVVVSDRHSCGCLYICRLGVFGRPEEGDHAALVTQGQSMSDIERTCVFVCVCVWKRREEETSD